MKGGSSAMTTPDPALVIFQQAVERLADFAGLSALVAFTPEDTTTVIRSKASLPAWANATELKPLRSIFDSIHLAQGSRGHHYQPMSAIADDTPPIPYPVEAIPDAELLKKSISADLTGFNSDDWQNLPSLSLIVEKFGGCLSYGDADISLFDLAKSTAAIATAIEASEAGDKQVNTVALIGGDLSGVQDFIYTIASDGALKSLRARSFYLELVAEEVVQQLLERLQLPRTSLIYTGASKLYLIAPAGEKTQGAIAQLREEVNGWLRREFQGKVFLCLDQVEVDINALGQEGFANDWTTINKRLSAQKQRKFDSQIGDLLALHHAYEPCKVCHRDDTDELGPLNTLDQEGPEACPTCRKMFSLGSELPDVGSMTRSYEPSRMHKPEHKYDGKELKIQVGQRAVYYRLFEATNVVSEVPVETTFLINNWKISDYQVRRFRNPTLLPLGNYGQKSEFENERGQTRKQFLPASKMAERSQGIQRVGHLRMDVDRLGQLFARGLTCPNLLRIASLSRQMSYFFKVYLNSLAAHRDRDFLGHRSQQPFQSLTDDLRQDLLFIYAGGDDLFVSGPWDQIVEFAFDVYQSFRAFTGWHPDITLSAGVSFNGPKYPLYQSAADAGHAEEQGKDNGRDSLGLFDQVFKWEEWLGCRDQAASEIAVIDAELKEYIGKDTTLALFGVLPFVRQLKDELGTQYSRSFVRNLLSTAQLQEQWIKQAKEEKSTQVKALRYFLHLPRVAYTLARVSKEVKNTKGFSAVSTSLKSPYNAPYFRAIATWLDLLNRSTGTKETNGQEQDN